MRYSGYDGNINQAMPFKAPLHFIVEERTIQCVDCGVEVTTKARSTKRCASCQEEAEKRYVIRANEKLKQKRQQGR